MSNHKIFRFKLNPDIVNMINDFSKLHERAEKKIYKEKWNDWLEANKEIIDREKIRLTELGFNKNVEDKMYRSGRYYFRKKSNDEDKDKDIKPRRKYISCDINFIELIDSHIRGSIETLKNDFKPSKEFLVFEEKYNNEINNEIQRIIESTETENIKKTDIVNKIKKTYKNRYRLLIT